MTSATSLKPARVCATRLLSENGAAFLFIIGALAVWEAAVWTFRVSPHLLPAPSRVLGYLGSHVGLYLEHSAVTLQSVAAGFGLALVISFFLATLISELPLLGQAVYPLLIASQAVPVIAIAPLLVMYLGYGILPKALVATLISFFPLTVNISRGLTSVDADAVTLLRTLGAGRVQIFFKAKVPHALTHTFAGIKISVVLATIGAVVGEWVGALKGLGHLILTASEQMSAELLFGAIVVTCALGVALYVIALSCERLLVPWK